MRLVMISLNSVLFFACSVPWFMVSLGERIEKTPLWPEVKDYFHMLYWILNYRPDVTTPPANCEDNSFFSLTIESIHLCI